MGRSIVISQWVDSQSKIGVGKVVFGVQVVGFSSCYLVVLSVKCDRYTMEQRLFRSLPTKSTPPTPTAPSIKPSNSTDHDALTKTGLGQESLPNGSLNTFILTLTLVIKLKANEPQKQTPPPPILPSSVLSFANPTSNHRTRQNVFDPSTHQYRLGRIFQQTRTRSYTPRSTAMNNSTPHRR